MSLDIAWQWQLVTFALLSLVSVIAAKIYLRGQATETDRPLLNKRAQQHIGRSYVLEEAIENGRGKIRVGDSLWRVEGPDRPKGERVVVTGADGTVLHVEPAEAERNKPSCPDSSGSSPASTRNGVRGWLENSIPPSGRGTQGLCPIGIGGASAMTRMEMRRFAARNGSSGNRGSESARPVME